MTETPVTAAVDFWRAQMALHKDRADTAEAELAEAKTTARKYRNQAHTWRLLYDNLLDKIAAKLGIPAEAAKGPNSNPAHKTK